MANVKKTDRVPGTEVERLNHAGIGLKAIARELNCNPATVTNRLKELGLKPVDTRRAFMERVYQELDPEQRDWLTHNLFNTGISIHTFVSQLIQSAYHQANAEPVALAPVPEMLQSAASVTIPAVEPEYVEDVSQELPVPSQASLFQDS